MARKKSESLPASASKNSRPSAAASKQRPSANQSAASRSPIPPFDLRVAHQAWKERNGIDDDSRW